MKRPSLKLLALFLAFVLFSGFSSCQDLGLQNVPSEQDLFRTSSPSTEGSTPSPPSEQSFGVRQDPVMAFQLNVQKNRDLEALSALETDGVTSPLFRRYFGSAFSASTLVAWLGARIREFRTAVPSSMGSLMVEGSRGEPLSVPAINLSFLGGSFYKHVLLMPPYLDPGYSAFERLSLLIHEARHSDGITNLSDHVGHEHVTCAGVPSSGLGTRGGGAGGGADVVACDSGGLGAYGYQGVFLREVSIHARGLSAEERRGLMESARRAWGRIRDDSQRRGLLAE